MCALGVYSNAVSLLRLIGFFWASGTDACGLKWSLLRDLSISSLNEMRFGFGGASGMDW